MFQFCPKCRNHYDDSYQEEECDGPASGGHSHTDSRPIDDHVNYTLAAAQRTRERTRHTTQERPVTASAGSDG